MVDGLPWHKKHLNNVAFVTSHHWKCLKPSNESYHHSTLRLWDMRACFPPQVRAPFILPWTLLQQGGRQDTDGLVSCVGERAGAWEDKGLCAHCIWDVWTHAIKWTHQDQMRQRGRHCPVKILSLSLADEPVSFKVSIIIIQQNWITVLTAYLNAHASKHTQTEEVDNTRIF